MNLTSRPNVYSEKINRYNLGKNLRVLDLFSGCGGLSLGFKKAGFDIIAAVELDKEAIISHATNFHKNSANFDSHCLSRDIKETDPDVMFKDLGLKGNVDTHIDVIIGGPPCQAFTRIGRAKLREVGNDTSAFLNDSRSMLYKRYLDYVKALKPLVILMENVPDILNYGGVNIADKVCDDLSNLEYNCNYTLLNSVYYGVPQMRERMFLIGVHKSIKNEIKFPIPTHYADLPKGYHGSRNVALKTIVNNSNQKYYKPAPIPHSELVSAVTALEALSDLPIIREHLNGGLKRGVKKTNENILYKAPLPVNEYQQLMRSWPGFSTNNEVDANVIRLLPRDYPVFSKMKPGDQYPQALEIARKIFSRKIIKVSNDLGRKIFPNSKKYLELVKSTIPPYDERKFPNKWRKMEADKPSRTLMAHLGKDSYSHIHYDNSQARTISVREAARLQSFPDGFVFKGAMNAAFRQIGNAVPPLLAEKIAFTVKMLLSEG